LTDSKIFKRKADALWLYLGFAAISCFLLPFKLSILNYVFPLAYLGLLFILSKHERQRLFVHLLLLCCVLIPFSNSWVVMSIGFLAVTWLSMGDWRLRGKNLLKSPFFWLFISVYVIHILGISYSENQQRAWKELEIKASLLALPIMLFSTKHLIGKHIQKLLISFIIGALIMVMGSYFFALQGLFAGVKDSFFYYHLSAPWGLNIVYYAMIVNAAFIFLAYLLHRNWKVVTIPIKLVGLLAIVIFVVFVFLSASILQVIALIVLVVIFSMKLALKQKKTWITILAPLLVIGLSFLLVSQFKVVDRFTIHYKRYKLKTNNKDGFHNRRLQLWQIAYDNIKVNPIIGVGTGDGQDVLNKTYAQKGLAAYTKKGNYNAHNQFLQFGLTFGMVGFLLFLVSLLWPLIVALKAKDLVYVLFMVLMILSMLTECILQRQAGVVLFAFFNSLLAIKMLKVKEV